MQKLSWRYILRFNFSSSNNANKCWMMFNQKYELIEILSVSILAWNALISVEKSNISTSLVVVAELITFSIWSKVACLFCEIAVGVHFLWDTGFNISSLSDRRSFTCIAKFRCSQFSVERPATKLLTTTRISQRDFSIKVKRMYILPMSGRAKR